VERVDDMLTDVEDAPDMRMRGEQRVLEDRSRKMREKVSWVTASGDPDVWLGWVKEMTTLEKDTKELKLRVEADAEERKSEEKMMKKQWKTMSKH
jgi:hypothetical protein